MPCIDLHAMPPNLNLYVMCKPCLQHGIIKHLAEHGLQCSGL
jgi:hypothetical protein